MKLAKAAIFCILLIGCAKNNIQEEMIPSDPYIDAFKGSNIKYLLWDIEYPSRTDTTVFDKKGNIKRIYRYTEEENRTYDSLNRLVKIDSRDFDIHSSYIIAYKTTQDTIIQTWIDSSKYTKHHREPYQIIFITDKNKRITKEMKPLTDKHKIYVYQNDLLVAKNEYSRYYKTMTSREVYVYNSKKSIQRIFRYDGNQKTYTHYYSNGRLDSTILEETLDSLNTKDEVIRYRYIYY